MRPPVRPPARSQISLKTVFTVCFGVLAVGALVLLVWHSVVALTLTLSAVMIAVALDHGVAFLQRRGLGRGLAIAIVTVAALALIVGLGFTVIPALVKQGKQLVAHAPELFKQARETRLFHFLDKEMDLAERINQLPKLIDDAAGPVLAVLGGVASVVGAAVTIFFLAIFMVIFGGRLVEALVGEALPERRHLYQKVLDKMYSLVGGYIGGLALICTINATLTTIFLAIIGAPFFLVLGILSGFSSMVPYAGPLAAGLSISIIALASGGMWKGIACAIYFVIYGQIEGNVLGPLIFRRTVHVNPLIVTLSILFFGEMTGIVGAIMAVPITAAAQIVLRELLRVRREQLALPATALNSPGESSVDPG
jgi:predicted PurR-regulated permease PerM